MTVDAAAILLERYEQLPPRAAAAAKVLRLIDDPDTSAQDLAKAMGADPVFAARVLRVANSAYYGLSGKVSTLPFAVSVIGFQTVRALAVVALAGLDDAAAAPEGFWEAAALGATGAELVASAIGADPGDAFSLGLLHTLGAALLHQHQALPQLCLPTPPDPGQLLLGEQERYGITHDVLGARVLRAWKVPEHLCELIERHHEAVLPDATGLERALHASRWLTDLALRADRLTTPPPGELTWLTEGRLDPGDLGPLLDRLVDRARALMEGLVPRR